MFKNFEDYKTKREKLLAEAESFLNNGKKQEYETKVKDIEKMDNDYENFAKETANLKTLREKQASVRVEGSFENEKSQSIEDKLATKEYRNAFFKKMQGKEMTDMDNALVTATSTIPTITMNKIIGVMEDNSILGKVDLSFIPGNVSFPKEKTTGEANWTAMGTASTDSADELETISLAAHKLIKTVEIGADVESMSIDAFESWLVKKLANKIEAACCNSILNGTGTNQPKGIFTTGSVTTTAVDFSKSGMTYKELMKIIASLGSAYRKNAEFIMNSEIFYNEILGMTTTTGERVVVADAQAPEAFRVLGYPVNICDEAPADTIAFGALEAYKFNFAKAPEIKKDESAGFRNGTTVWRAMALADGTVGDDKAFVIAKKKTT